MNSLPPSRPYLPFGTSDPETESMRSFNPKRVSQAAARPLPARPKLTAPYVHLDFQHQPVDREVQRGYAKVSKRTIKALRIGSIALRLLQLLGTMGLLITVLLVRKIDDMTGWICRVPPVVAAFHIVYSVYHLSGSYRALTPASTVAYYLFASTVDIAIISFYSFIAVLTWKQHMLGIAMDWATVFASPSIDQRIIMTLFLLTCTIGGLTLLSLCLTLFLIKIFRRLANLPPDMNPFLAPKGSLTRKPAKKRFSASTINTARTIPFTATRHPGPVDVPSPRESTRFSFPPPPASTASPRMSVMSDAPRYSAISLSDSPRNSVDAPRHSLVGDAQPESPSPRGKKKSYSGLHVPVGDKDGGKSPQRMGVARGRVTSATLGDEGANNEWRYRKPSGDAGRY